MSQPGKIRQPWLTLARGAWVILATYIALPGILGIPAFYQQWLALDPGSNTWGWTQATLTSAAASAGLSAPVVAWIILLPALLEILVFLSTGLLIFWRKSDEWEGLLVSFALVGLCGTFTGDRFQLFTGLTPFWQTVAEEVRVLIWLAFFFFLAIFPDGRFTPPWMRWVSLGLVPWWLAVEGTRLFLGQTPDWQMWNGFIFLALIVFSKVTRYRQGSQVERQQIRWFLFAIIVLCAYGMLWFVFVRLFPLPAQPGALELAGYLVDNLISVITFILLPLAIGFAIFRYRLWDIDLVIRRTLQYGALTILLGFVYFGGVLALQQVFRLATGQESPLAVVLSTLAIAALFTPLRSRIQAFIDRRFYRARYDAGQALERFSYNLKEQVDLSAIQREVTGVISRTLQPAQVSLWLRKGK